MPAKSPFKFLDSYTPADRHLFFGRESELEELHQKLFKAKHFIIYGSSGTGKTSLVQCGLSLKMEDSDWMPVAIRRGYDINQSIPATLTPLAITPIRKAKSMADYIHSVYLDYFKPVYLIFDQFEELFIFGREEEIQQFILSVRECLERELTCRFIFVIRGEYLENIALFEEEIPQFFENRMHIERMTRNNALRVITESCRAFGIQYSADFPTALLDRLSSAKATIELTYLQVYLDKLYKNAAEVNPASIVFDEALLEKSGMIEDVLSEFLDEQVAHTKDPETTITILKSFVSGEGTKKPCTLPEVGDFCESLGKPLTRENLSALLKQFVDLRILKDMDDTGRYELRHDALAGKIYEQISLVEKEQLEVRQFLNNRFIEFRKRQVVLSPTDLQYIALYENKLFLNEEQKQFIEKSKRQARLKKNRRRNIAVAAGLLLLLILSGFSLFALKQRNEAVAQSKIAELKTQEALNQKEIAEKSNEMALEASRQALDAKSYAELQSRIADEQKKIAQEQAQRAEQQTELAKSQQGIAETQKQLAEQKSGEALIQKQKADSAEREATRLRLLSLSQTLALQSLQVKDDRQLGALLALESFALSEENGGNIQDPQLIAAMFENLKLLNPNYSPVIIRVGSAIKAIGAGNSGQSLLVLKGDGMLSSYSAVDHTLQNSVRASAGGSPMNTGYISPDGKLVAVAYENHTLTIFQIQTGNVSSPVTGHTGLIRAVAFSSNPGLFATGARDSTVIVWNSGVAQKKFRFDSRIRALSMSNDQSTLAVGCDDGTMYLVNIASESKKLMATSAPARIQSGGYSRSGKYIAFGTSAGTIHLFGSSGAAIKTIGDNSGSVDFLLADESLQSLASATVTRMIHVYSLSDLSQKPIAIKDLPSSAVAMMLLPSGKLVIGCADNNIREFETNSEVLKAKLMRGVSRNLTQEEWNTYIGNDVTYHKIRADLP
jgi:hypothetical protein